jgi:hypothetical protein
MGSSHGVSRLRLTEAPNLNPDATGLYRGVLTFEAT